MAAARATQIRITRVNLHPFAGNSVRPARARSALPGCFLGAAHHGTQEDGFELTAVISEVTMRLAEDRNDLRHLETERAVLVGERGAMTLRLMFLPFRRVRPDLDALASERCAVAGAADGAAHPEAAFADPVHDGRALAV